MQKVRLFRFLILFFAFNLFSSINASVENKIKELSYLDRIKIKFFFKVFFLQDGVGHTLFFATKPISTTGFFVKKNRPVFDNFFLNLIENVHDHFFEKGWIAWKRNEHLFPHANFIFAEDETTFIGNERVRNIYVINRRNLLECLKKNEQIFREVLGENFSVINFVEKLENEKQVLPLINHSECLLGILLGYGYESSSAFENQSLGIEQASYSGINIAKPENCPIWPIGFMGDPDSEEVQNLVKIYEKELKELDIMFRNSKDFLNMLLTQLTYCN
jgi:hypothetical protein